MININYLATWDNLRSVFEDNQYSVLKLSSDTRQEWDRIVDSSRQLSYQYISNNVVIDKCVMTAKCNQYIDLSILIKKNGVILALWPFSIYENDLRWHLASGGNSILPPYVTNECSPKDEKTIYACCLKAINYVAKSLCCEKISFEVASDECGINYRWERCLHDYRIVNHQLIQNMYVDLRNSEDVLWSSIRKRYRSLITKAEKEYMCEVYSKDNISTAIWNEFRAFFVEIKGRDTKSEQTWAQHDTLIRHGQSILLIIRDRADMSIVGGAIFVYNKHHSYYMSGAYNKAHKNVGHFVQYSAIKYLKSIGVKWHYIGEMFYSDFNEKISEKELNISEFKRGFATNIYWTCIYDVELIDVEETVV